MPKVASSLQSKLESYVKTFGSESLSTDGHVLFCKVCERDVTAERKSQVTQHLNGVKHRSKLTKKQGSASSSVVQMAPFLKAAGKQSQYSLELCDTFLSADIPLHKLEHEKVKNFLEKWSKQETPSAVTLRLNYIQTVYERKMESIRKFIGGKSIWISMDETTDVTGRFVAHTVVGTLGTTETRQFLLHAECLDKTNSSTIAQAFINSSNILWPSGIDHNKVLPFLTDAAAYMIKAGSALKVVFPRMLHVTCANHALHRVAEDIRQMFPDVDKLIASGKRIFLKSAARTTILRELAPDRPLPPQPILTRWGTWVLAAVYYADNFDAFASVVDALDSNDSACIPIVKQLTKKMSVKADLAFIKSHFELIPNVIKKLETRGMPLYESLAVFDELLRNLKDTPGSHRERLRKKCETVVLRNPDYDKLRGVSDVLCGRPMTGTDFVFDATELASFKYAPITSVDVERTSSVLKNTLNDRRQKFTFGNLRQVIVVLCNQ